MIDKLSDLDDTILELKKRISEDPDPFLVQELEKLQLIRANQQERLVARALPGILRKQA
jgi:hypothetical protein